MDTGKCRHPGRLLERFLWKWSVQAGHVETRERVVRVNTQDTRQSSVTGVMGKIRISSPEHSTWAGNFHLDIMGKHCL